MKYKVCSGFGIAKLFVSFVMRIVLSVMLLVSATVAQAAPPVLTISSGSTAFVEDGVAVAIDPSLTVVEPNATAIDGATVAITTGYVSTEDRLVYATTAGINGSFSTTTGILTLTGSTTPANYQAALRAVQYQNINTTAPNTGTRTIRYALGSSLSFAGNGHFYEFVTDSGITWTAARDAAAARTLFGLQGYLTTVTSADENTFIFSKLVGEGWMGASDEAVEDDWRWVTGPEAGTAFWNGVANGSPVGGEYNNWNSGEPNQSGEEDYAHFLSWGPWNDYPHYNSNISGYIVEYGGMSGDPALQIAGNKSVTVTAQNDAPSFSAGAILSAINEDTLSPVGATVTSMLNVNYTDADGTDALAGIAVSTDVSVNGVEGDWEYTTDGSNWYDIGTISTASALLLDVSARLRFVPFTHYNGTPGTLTVYTVDNSSATTFTSGATRQTFNTTTDDATSKVSAAGVLVGTSINAVNDIPTLTNFSAVLDSVNEDTEVEITLAEIQTLGNENDVEDGTISRFIIKAVSSGTLNIGANSGAAVAWAATSNDTIDGSNNAYWTPVGNASGTINSFTVVAEDSSAAESTPAVQATVAVSAINDDPTMGGLPTDVTVTEDTLSNINLSAATFADVDSASSDVVLTIAVDVGALSSADASNVTVGGTSNVMSFTGTAANIDTFLNTVSNIKYTPVANAAGNDIATLTLSANDGGNTGSGGGNNVALGTTVNIDVTDTPDLISATYDFNTNELVVTGNGFSANAGAQNDVDISLLTLTGEGGATYQLVSATDVEISTATEFTVNLSGADLFNVEALLNKNGLTADSGTAYNIAAADDFITATTAGDISSNSGVTVSNYAAPTITSATYDWGTGQFTLTGTNFVSQAGGTNDVIAIALNIAGEGGNYTLTDTANVEIASAATAILTLSTDDKLNVHGLLNKNGTVSSGSTTYNLAGSDGWMPQTPGDESDLTGNGMTVSNVAIPTITSMTYDADTGEVIVTGTNFFKKIGANNDVDISAFTFTGEGGGTYQIVSASDIEITSATSFSFTLVGADKTNVDALLGQFGTSSSDLTTYNIAAADNWLAGADAATDISDLTSNGVTVTINPTINSATYNASTGTVVVIGANIQANGGGSDINASLFTFTGEGGGSYQLINTLDVNRGSVTGFTLILDGPDNTAVNALLNNTGSSSADSTTYNLAAADNWNTNVIAGDSSNATVSITVINTAPTLTGFNGDSVNFNINGTAVELDNGGDATLADLSSPNLDDGSVTVSIITNGQSGEDVLQVGDVAAISISGSNIRHSDSGGMTIGSFTGGSAGTDLVISLNSDATIARVQDLLRALQYENSGSVSLNTLARTVTVRTVIVDGDGGSDTSANQEVTVNVIRVPILDLDLDDSSGNTVGGNNTSYTEDSAKIQVTDSDVSINDDGLTYLSLTATLVARPDGDAVEFLSSSIANDQVVDGVDTVSVVYTQATGELVFSPAVGDGDGFLNDTTTRSLMMSVHYINYSDVPDTANRNVSFVLEDEDGNTGPASTAVIAINTVNDAPVFTGLDATLVFTEGGAAAVLDSNVTVADLELEVASDYNAAILSLARNSGANASDVFAVTTSGFATETVNAGGSLVLIFGTATAANVATVMQSITYRNSSNAPAATVQIDWTFSDGNSGNQGSGGALTTTGSTTVSITATDDPHTGAVTISGSVAEYQTLTANANDLADLDGLGAFSYQWKSGGSNVGTNSNLYTITTADIGNTITVTVSFTDSGGTLEIESSSPTAAVSNTNDSPTGSVTISGIATEDQPLTVSNTLADGDGLGTISYQWKRNGSAISGATGGGYSLGDEDVGQTITVTASYTDLAGFSESMTSNAMAAVANINDEPTGSVSISGVTIGGQTLTASNTLADVDGLGILSYQWKSASTNVGINSATYTLLASDVSNTLTVTVSYTDGQGTAESVSSSATSVVVADNTIPVVTAPNEITVDATGLFTQVDLGSASAIDVEDGELTASTNHEGHFSPGTHTVTWTASDSNGGEGTAEQTVNVIPLVSLSKNQVSAEGSTARFKVMLNGSAVTYPVTVPYTVSGTVLNDGSDHNLGDGSVTIESPNLEISVDIDLVDDGVGEGVETLVITLGSPTNAVTGAASTHQIDIYEGNVAPEVELSATQGGGATRIIGQTDGVVTVTATVTDPNVNDTHSYDWTETNNALVDTDSDETSFTIDPSGLTPGVYTLRLLVNDGSESDTAELVLNVKATLPTLTAIDSDGDGVSDDSEGLGDSDGDGVPDYLDHSGIASNVVQEKSGTSTSFLMETEPGLQLSLGDIAFQSSGERTGVSTGDVSNYANEGAGAEADTEYHAYNGGVFDFTVEDLPVAGQSVRIVMAQFAAIPANAVYRKLVTTGWQDFVVDANNHVASAPGAEGFCPAPGDAAYVDGLTEGHWCVQLTIEDGGANDTDGEANGSIEDPGGVSEQLPQSLEITISGDGGGGASSQWLLLLLSLGLLLRYSRIRRAIYLLPLLFVAANAQAESPFVPSYVGAAYLGVDSDERSADFENDMAALGLAGSVTQTDLSRGGVQAYLGYQMDDQLAFEFGYVDLGDVTTKISGTAANIDSYLDTATAVHPTTAAGWTFNFVLRKAIHDRVDLLGKLGVLWWDADYTLISPTASRNFSTDGMSGSMGIALEVDVTAQIPIRVGWERYRLAGIDIDTWTLGFGYHF